MSTPFEHLDERMNARRLDLGRNWRQIADAAGVSAEALRAIRRGKYQPSELTQRKMEDALQWAPGSVAAVLAGGEPAATNRGRRSTDTSLAAAIGAEVRAAIGNERVQVNYVARVLQIDRDAARDRLEGRVPFSHPELVNIAEDLGINHDELKATAERAIGEQATAGANEQAK